MARACAMPIRSMAAPCCRPWAQTSRSSPRASRARNTAPPTAPFLSAPKGRPPPRSTARCSNGARRTCRWCRRGSITLIGWGRNPCCSRSPIARRRKRLESGARIPPRTEVRPGCVESVQHPFVPAKAGTQIANRARAARIPGISAFTRVFDALCAGMSGEEQRRSARTWVGMISFIHDLPAQRVVFAPGAIARVADEAARLGFNRALVIATPGSGARLGGRLVEILGARAAGLHAQASLHVPKPVAEAGVAAARGADGLVAAGGGAAIGLAKIIARDLGLPILAVPTTYSGSEATAIWGMSEGERKLTGKDVRVLPRTIVYDPELTLALPAAVSAASGMNGIAHCVEALWVGDRTPFLMALASDAARPREQRRPRGTRGVSRRCLARRRRARLRHRPAAQARARAGRPRPAARRNPRDHPAPCHPFQPGGGAAGAGAARGRARRRWCGAPGRPAARLSDPAAVARGRIRSRQNRFRRAGSRGDVNHRAAQGGGRGRADVARGGVLKR